jgi:putative colanic acid biosysnthesis UDP-glucose lipid carrier transferase
MNTALMDLFSINAVFFICQHLLKKYALIGDEIEYMHIGFFINVSWLFSVLITGVYNKPYIYTFESFTKRTFHAFTTFLLVIFIPLFFLRIFILSAFSSFIVLSLVFLALLINRFIYLGFYQYFKNRDWLVNKVVVIGYNDLSKELVSCLEEDGFNKQVIGYCEEYENIDELSRYPIMGRINTAIEICKTHNVSEIYSTIGPKQNPAIYNLIEQAGQNCIRFRLVPDLRFFINRKIHVDYLRELTIFNLRNEPLEDLTNRIKKRVFDIAVSLFVTVFILSWLIPIIGLLIWIESKGPIFFSQPRSGKDNKTFDCLKFRSMKVNSNANLLQATRNDARITKIGKFLRRTSLDEFPQFINVLKGEMSIVGPRPHMLKHTDEYSRQIDQYMIRHFMKPGITGWAQVNGYRGETRNLDQMQKRIEYDLWYQENWNLLFDLRIVFMTVINAIRGEENAA